MRKLKRDKNADEPIRRDREESDAKKRRRSEVGRKDSDRNRTQKPGPRSSISSNGKEIPATNVDQGIGLIDPRDKSANELVVKRPVSRLDPPAAAQSSKEPTA